MTYVDVVTFGIALVGAILGIIATWHQWSQSRVKLRIVPKRSYSMGGSQIVSGETLNPQMQQLEKQCLAWWSIEVVNLSTFPLTISEVGFGTRKRHRQVVMKPMITNDQTLPYRLEPRTSVLIHAHLQAKFNPELLKNNSAFAVTDCGAVKFGSSPIFRQFVRSLKSGDDGSE